MLSIVFNNITVSKMLKTMQQLITITGFHAEIGQTVSRVAFHLLLSSAIPVPGVHLCVLLGIMHLHLPSLLSSSSLTPPHLSFSHSLSRMSLIQGYGWLHDSPAFARTSSAGTTPGLFLHLFSIDLIVLYPYNPGNYVDIIRIAFI